MIRPALALDCIVSIDGVASQYILPTVLAGLLEYRLTELTDVVPYDYCTVANASVLYRLSELLDEYSTVGCWSAAVTLRGIGCSCRTLYRIVIDSDAVVGRCIV